MEFATNLKKLSALTKIYLRTCFLHEQFLQGPASTTVDPARTFTPFDMTTHRCLEFVVIFINTVPRSKRFTFLLLLSTTRPQKSRPFTPCGCRGREEELEAGVCCRSVPRLAFLASLHLGQLTPITRKSLECCAVHNVLFVKLEFLPQLSKLRHYVLIFYLTLHLGQLTPIIRK